MLQNLREISLLCNTLDNNMPVWDMPGAVQKRSTKELPLVELNATESSSGCKISVRTVEMPMNGLQAETAKSW